MPMPYRRTYVVIRPVTKDHLVAFTMMFAGLVLLVFWLLLHQMYKYMIQTQPATRDHKLAVPP